MDNEGPDDELGIFGLYATSSKGSKSYHVEVDINGENMDMQIDTAADYSIMSRDTYVKKFVSIPLQTTDIKLKTCIHRRNVADMWSDHMQSCACWTGTHPSNDCGGKRGQTNPTRAELVGQTQAELE